MKITLSSSVIAAGDSIEVLPTPESIGLEFEHIIDWEITPIGKTEVTAGKIMIQGSPDGASAPSGVSPNINGDGATISPALAVGSTAERIANGLFDYRLSGAPLSLAADAVGAVFSAAHVIAASKWGAIAVYVNDAGDISTKINSTNQTDTLSFDTAILALQNVQDTAFDHPPDEIRIGYVLIENNGSLWTANTDDLTDASDVTTATFFQTTSSFTEIDEHELTAPDIVAQKGTFYLDASLKSQYIRYYLSSITGQGTFNITGNLAPV